MTDDALAAALAEQRRRSDAMVVGLASAANLGSVPSLDRVDDDTDEWWNTTDVCRYLSLNPRTVYKAVECGQLRAHRRGQAMRYRPTDVDAYLESCRVKPGSLANLRHP